MDRPLQDRESRKLLLTIAANLRCIRQERQLTQEELAARAGVAARHLQKIEAADVNLTVGTLANIAAALHVEASTLLDALPRRRKRRD